MEKANIGPGEYTLCTIIKTRNSFEDALHFIDFFIDKKYFVRRASFEAAYAKSIIHMPPDELLFHCRERRFKFDTALNNQIQQYINNDLKDYALQLIMVAPHISVAKTFSVQEYDLCRSYFQREMSQGNKAENVYYAFGIAAWLNCDWGEREAKSKHCFYAN